MSNINAYLNGFEDARSYRTCNPVRENADEVSQYTEGYRDGMEINLKYEGGICPEFLRNQESIKYDK